MVTWLSRFTTLHHTSAWLTVTLHSAFAPPAVALMSALPSATPRTMPPLTVATSSRLLCHTTVRSSAFSGRTVAVSRAVPSTLSSRVLRSSVTLLTGTLAAFTVTVQLAVLPPTLARMMAAPAARAVTMPPSTTAASSLELVHTMLLWGMLVGSTVAVRVAVLPSVSSSVPALSIRLAALRPSSATVTLHAAFTPPAMAAISVVPAQMATTSPPVTLAVSGSALYHTTA